MAVDILMPALSPTMTEGKLARWLRKEGEPVRSGDVIAEIETDKATMEVEAVDEGILGRILIPEGAEGVAVNTPIAILIAEGEAVPEATAPAPDAAAAPPPAARAPEPAPSPAPAPAAAAPRKTGEKTRLFASPLARKVAAALGVALESVKGTGPGGRIVRRDVENAKAAPPVPAASPAFAGAPEGELGGELGGEPGGDNVTRVPHSPMRKAIARRLSESKATIPHFYTTFDLELDALLDLRGKLNAAIGEDAPRLSVNDLMIKAVALALRKVPAVNARFTEKEMILFGNVDISVAVAIPDGLITPIIRDADRKSVRAISAEARDLAARARAGKLKPEEFQGGTFSISNLGMFGVREFSAIINPPQAGILALSAAGKRPVVRGDALAIATVMSVTLSADHRAVDGALAAQWLGALRDIVQNPYTLVI